MLGSPQREAQAYTYAERYTQGSHVEKKKNLYHPALWNSAASVLLQTANRMEAKMTLFWPLLSNGGLCL